MRVRQEGEGETGGWDRRVRQQGVLVVSRGGGLSERGHGIRLLPPPSLLTDVLTLSQLR